MRHKTIDVTFDIKAVEDDGFFSGYGSVFGNVDSYREIVKRGAFVKSLDEWQARSRMPPVLWNHNHNEPIGVYTKMEEDENGLYVEGRLLVGEVQRAREIHALMKAGAIDGMSIGYAVKRSQKADRGVVNLLELKLFEVSIVTFPANEESRVDAVKAALEEGELPTLPEFEKFLREAGFSKTQSAAIATSGLSKLLRGEPGDKQASKSVSDALAFLKAHNGVTQ